MFDFDKSFIERLISKDKNTFNEFYLKTVDIFFRYVKSNYFIKDEDIEDLISVFYYKLWNGLDNYEYMKGFNSWVWTIFKNNLKDYFKKIKDVHFSNISNSEDTNFEEILEDDTNIMDMLESDFEFEQIKQAIEQLDEISKEIIFLKYIEGLTNSEISDMMSIKETTIRQRLSRGLKKLKSILGK